MCNKTSETSLFLFTLLYLRFVMNPFFYYCKRNSVYLRDEGTKKRLRRRERERAIQDDQDVKSNSFCKKWKEKKNRILFGKWSKWSECRMATEKEQNINRRHGFYFKREMLPTTTIIDCDLTSSARHARETNALESPRIWVDLQHLIRLMKLNVMEITVDVNDDRSKRLTGLFLLCTH